ncbi:mitochondrial import receptor subunit TOM40 homolog 1-like [Stegodyphus dumicola]|uniref:mitochondrial import receptor subunit TOM40 homolog 1-like n=1 Tax=Stegodyphus dumicola TaxID=202533 RepID=UPI0015AC5D0B|nr:mitochondrial import receptor subunit TOM40 homolog 1-like [Stegodyphus dumicola]
MIQEKKLYRFHQTLNPGTVQDLHKKCEDVFPSVFEGVELILGHELGNHFQIGHSIKWSTEAPSGYSFMTTYVGTNQFGPMEKYPVLAGAVDPSGTMTAKMIHKYKNIHGMYFTQVGVDLKTNFRSSESVCSIGYQIDLPKANLVFRGKTV